MNKKFINYIIKRYLRFDKEHPFIYISFLLAFLGILTGVATLMIAMGIMNGMDKEFEKKLKVMNYPLTIYSAFREIDKEFLTSLEKKFPDFKFSPYLQTSAVLKSGNEMKGILLYGVDFNKEQEVNEVIKQYLPNRKIGIFDVTGKLVKTLITDKQSVSPGIVHWNGQSDTGRPLPSGVYFYRLSAPDFTATRKIVLLK